MFYGNFLGGSHLGVMTSPYMERIRAAVTGWRLMGDLTLTSMFVGSDCTLCRDRNWSVKSKNDLK